MYYPGQSHNPNNSPWDFNQGVGESVIFEPGVYYEDTTQTSPSGYRPRYQPSPTLPIFVFPQNAPIEQPQPIRYIYPEQISNEWSSVSTTFLYHAWWGQLTVPAVSSGIPL